MTVCKHKHCGKQIRLATEGEKFSLGLPGYDWVHGNGRFACDLSDQATMAKPDQPAKERSLADVLGAYDRPVMLAPKAESGYRYKQWKHGEDTCDLEHGRHANSCLDRTYAAHPEAAVSEGKKAERKEGS